MPRLQRVRFSDPTPEEQQGGYIQAYADLLLDCDIALLQIPLVKDPDQPTRNRLLIPSRFVVPKKRQSQFLFRITNANEFGRLVRTVNFLFEEYGKDPSVNNRYLGQRKPPFRVTSCIAWLPRHQTPSDPVKAYVDMQICDTLTLHDMTLQTVDNSPLTLTMPLSYSLSGKPFSVYRPNSKEAWDMMMDAAMQAYTEALTRRAAARR